MGIQDRDYWRERYKQNSRASNLDPTHWREDELSSPKQPSRSQEPERLLAVVTLVFATAFAVLWAMNYLSERLQLQSQMHDAQMRATAQAREQAIQQAQLLH